LRLLQQAVRVNPLWGPKVVGDPAFAALKGVAGFDALGAAARGR
jgi:hypothetical protein